MLAMREAGKASETRLSNASSSACDSSLAVLKDGLPADALNDGDGKEGCLGGFVERSCGVTICRTNWLKIVECPDSVVE